MKNTLRTVFSEKEELNKCKEGRKETPGEGGANGKLRQHKIPLRYKKEYLNSSRRNKGQGPRNMI
jgi:hypothetical protein